MPEEKKKSKEKLHFKKRVNPKEQEISNLIYYKSPNPFSKNPLVGKNGGHGNCTWYAWGRFWEVWAQGDKQYQTKKPWPGSPNGNAFNWVSHASKSGKFKTGLTPRPGAIICWGYWGSPSGDPGHVAFVEEVYSNGDIEVSQSGFSTGNMANQILKKGNGKAGTGAYKTGYNNSYFNGFIYNPIDFGAPNGGVSGDGGPGFDMQQAISTLYSSEKEGQWQYIEQEESEERAAEKRRQEKIKQFLGDYYDNLKRTGGKQYTSAIAERIAEAAQLIGNIAEESLPNYDPEFLKLQSQFLIGSNVVEAPFVQLDIEGYKIGTYNGATDKWPNHITSLDVKKTNGEINLYTINLVHQIRAGEDPNVLDKLFSKVRYNKITISYGDCNTGAIFRDAEAIITNVNAKRDYVSNRINYTISATSAGHLVSTYKTTFPTVTARPSTVIRDLLYSNPETSAMLLDAFPGMKDQKKVEQLGLIPNDDIELTIQGKTMISPLDYINFLVGCMSGTTNERNSVIRDSVYYVSYHDNELQELDGPYIKISKVSALSDYSKFNSSEIFTVVIGYPDNNFIYNFNVGTDNAWSLLYNKANISSEHVYNIDNQGELNKQYSPTISKASNILNEMDKNWWTQMTQFPINATLTMKGLLRPVMLMDYVVINVVFYGQAHNTSGVYVVTGQEDKLSGNGFSTTLSLTRVGDNV